MSVSAFALAQPADDAAKESEARKRQSLDEVVITGSRIQRQATYESVNATDSVTAEEMRTVGATTVAEMIQQIPGNISSISPENVGDNPAGISGTIANLRGMNTASGTRTLTLVDGKRYVPTNDGGAVNLQVIPSALVSRMDAVTGGASATYGSDALAGVVNIILDKEVQGIRMDGSWGQTSEGDGNKWKGSFVAGTGLWNGKAHVTFSFEHAYQASINDCESRAYCRASRGMFDNSSSFFGYLPYENRSVNPDPSNPFWSPPPLPGQPEFLVQDGLRFGGTGVGYVFNTKPGSVANMRPDINPALWNLDPGGYWAFNEAGTALVPILQNLTPAQSSAVTSNGVDGLTPFGLGPGAYNQVPLIAGSKTDSGVGYFSYLFDNSIKTSATVSFSRTVANAQQNTNRQMGWSSAIYPDNPYLATLSQQDQAIILSRMEQCLPRPYQAMFGSFFLMPWEGTTCYNLSKVWTDQLGRHNQDRSKVLNISLDANGPIGENWSWKSYATFGQTKRLQTIADWATRSRWAMANDTIVDPADGTIKCRIASSVGTARRNQWISFYQTTLGENTSVAEASRWVDTLAEGCQPVNPFGYAASRESLAYSWPTYPMETTQTMISGSASLSGDLWKGWGAGPFQLAAGIDYDSNKSESTVNTDPIRAADILVAFGGEWSGRTTNIAPFAELEVPLLAKLPGAEMLHANFAYRLTRNKTERYGDEAESSSRNITSWKTSMIWGPIQSLRVRATYSRDTRAPSARELYSATARTAGSIFSDSNAIDNPWVSNDPATPQNENSDTYLRSDGANPDLRPETSTTKTIGIVFTPSGALQGIATSVDFYHTKLDGGITLVDESGVLSGCYQHLTIGLHNNYCDNITFGPETVPGNPYSNIETIATSQENSQGFTYSGIDYSISYFKQLRKSSFNVRLMASQFLKQDVYMGELYGWRDVSGQVGASGIGSFFGCVSCAYTPTPRWQGNFWGTYTIANLASTLQIRYVGAGRLNNQNGWIGPGETGHYTNPATGEEVYVEFDPDLANTINNPNVPSWTLYNLHFNYSFAESRFGGGALKGLELEAHVYNVTNKQPEQYTGRGAGGINSTYYSGLGRQYQFGLRYRY